MGRGRTKGKSKVGASDESEHILYSTFQQKACLPETSTQNHPPFFLRDRGKYISAVCIILMNLSLL